MALSNSSLSSKIQAEIINLYGPADDPNRLKDFADAMAKAIIDEITSNAELDGIVVDPLQIPTGDLVIGSVK